MNPTTGGGTELLGGIELMGGEGCNPDPGPVNTVQKVREQRKS